MIRSVKRLPCLARRLCSASRCWRICRPPLAESRPVQCLVNVNFRIAVGACAACLVFVAVKPAVAANSSCKVTVRAEVAAIEHAYQYNRFGAFNPAGLVFALQNDLVPQDIKLADEES